MLLSLLKLFSVVTIVIRPLTQARYTTWPKIWVAANLKYEGISQSDRGASLNYIHDPRTDVQTDTLD